MHNATWPVMKAHHCTLTFRLEWAPECGALAVHWGRCCSLRRRFSFTLLMFCWRFAHMRTLHLQAFRCRLCAYIFITRSWQTHQAHNDSWCNKQNFKIYELNIFAQLHCKQRRWQQQKPKKTTATANKHEICTGQCDKCPAIWWNH